VWKEDDFHLRRGRGDYLKLSPEASQVFILNAIRPGWNESNPADDC
jgi:hypothetical protein